MKGKIIATALAIAMTMGLSTAAMAGRGGESDFGPRSGGEMGPGAFYTRMAKALNLTEAQKGQIKALIKSERESTKPLMEKIFESRKQLRQAGESTTFDEAAVRNIVAGMSQTEADLAVIRVRTHSQIYTLLTPEQREKAKNLKPDMKRRPKSPPPGDSE